MRLSSEKLRVVALPIFLLFGFLIAGCSPIPTKTPMPTLTATTKATDVPPTVATVATVAPTATQGMAGMSGMDGTADTSDVVNTHPGDAAIGKVLFEKGTGDAAVPACSACHNVDTEEIRVGPSLKNIVVHAKMHAEEHKQDVWTFLHNSIVKPNEDLMEDEPPHVYSANGVSLMFQYYGGMLTETQINDLVAYLMTLR